MQSTLLVGCTILVVEDEPLISMEIVGALQRAGATVVAAAQVERARELVEQDGLSAAVLDFGLHGGDADPICARLNARRIPYVLHSGYTHFGDACHRGVVIAKPASPQTLIDALVDLLGRGDFSNAQRSNSSPCVQP